MSEPTYYNIRHITKYYYSDPITESFMEVRMQPRSEGAQRCWNFRLNTDPRGRIMAYRDAMGNMVHHFDVPSRHSSLTISAEALVELSPPPPLPETLEAGAWDEIDALTADGDYWDMLAPSRFARPTDLLHELAEELRIGRGGDPLTTLVALNSTIHGAFTYVPRSTRVDSPIDDALRTRQGVCQDYAHILITLVRKLGIPCRYISGYLFNLGDDTPNTAEDATHAWIEAFLPDLGWVGLDPTNDRITDHHYIRVAIGRDYADVPPTRGVYKGDSDTKSELSVAVQVSPTAAPLADETLMPEPLPTTEVWSPSSGDDQTLHEHQEQQQQGWLSSSLARQAR